jgi:hypothetical protein
MPHLECPRCSTRISTIHHPTHDECPYCLARGINPVPTMRRSSLFQGAVPSRFVQPDGAPAMSARVRNARLAAKRLGGDKRNEATGRFSQSRQAG